MIYEKYIQEREIVEEIVMVGPMADGDAVLKDLSATGWRTSRSGPYTNRDMHPSVDMTRFLIRAYRALDVAGK